MPVANEAPNTLAVTPEHSQPFYAKQMSEINYHYIASAYISSSPNIFYHSHAKKYQNILAYSDYLPYLCTRNNNNGVGGIAQPVRAHDS